jgi:calcineurin-like phosphoesterase family protein
VTFLIADLHFWHLRVLDYSNEHDLFSSIEQRNETLISNWNKTVKKSDTVYFLGDFAFCSREKMTELYNRLNGYKIIIMGNHDHSYSFFKGLFDEASRYPIIIEDFYILSHEPVYINDQMPYFNIFGHVHNSPQFKDFSNKHFIVSVERIGYKPISLNEIKKKAGIK